MLNKKEKQQQLQLQQQQQQQQPQVFGKTGHMCMVCGFSATTKNKYRELQDHLVRQHFQDRIKAALPSRRPFVCPDESCNVEGKDWQALMRHYTGKHGILESYLKEVIANGLVNKAYRENAKKPRISALNPVLDEYQDNKENGQRRSRAAAAAARRQQRKKRPSSSCPEGNNNNDDDGDDDDDIVPTDHSPALTTNDDHVVEVDDTDIAESPTHLALVLKRQKMDPNGFEMPPEETYAFVDLKYFMPVSANKYIFKGSCLDADPTPHGVGGADSFCLNQPQLTDSPYILPQVPAHHHHHHQQEQQLPPSHEYPHLYQPTADGMYGEQTIPDSTTTTTTTNANSPGQFFGGVQQESYHHHQGGSTILIPPDSIVAPCSAVSTSLTLPSDLAATTTMINDSLVTSSYLPSSRGPVATQIDLGQIVRQTIETPTSCGGGAMEQLPTSQEQYVLQPPPPLTANVGSHLYSIPINQYPDIPTASAEAAEAALIVNHPLDCCGPPPPSDEPVKDDDVAEPASRVLVEEAKIINVEGTVVHHQAELIRGGGSNSSCCSSEVASTVTVVSSDGGDNEAASEECDLAVATGNKGMKTQLEFSLF